MRTINRRDFLKQFGLVVGGAVLLPACDFGRSAAAAGFRALTPEVASCLGAMCDQIIPPDDWPGATQAGVLDYIDKQTVLRFPHERALYEAGVEHLQAYCRDAFGAGFENLEDAARYRVMQDMEAGRLPEHYWTRVDQRRLFNLVRSRTMQGFYGPPRHGGNKNFISYRMMRLDYPLVVGQNRYNP